MKRWLVILFLIAMGECFFPPRANSSTDSIIKVQIEGLSETEGQICYSLFDKSEGFPNRSDNIIQAKCVSIRSLMPTFTINNLHYGTYALAVFHDVNKDEELNRSFIRIPQEGFGFSQNPEVITSAPSFSDSAVIVTGAETNLRVQLRYF